MNFKKFFAALQPAALLDFGDSKARALVDIPGTGIKAGEFFTANINRVNALVADGLADPHAKESDVYGADIPPAKHLEGRKS